MKKDLSKKLSNLLENNPNTGSSKFENKINVFLASISTNKNSILVSACGIIAFLEITFIALFIISKLMLIFFISLFILCLIFIYNSIILGRKNRAKNYLKKSIEKFNSGNHSEVIDLMIGAYNILKSPDLWEILISYTKQNPPLVSQLILISEIDISKSRKIHKNDEKIIEILDQINNIVNYLKKHNDVCEKSQLKINEIENEIGQTDYSQSINEFKNLKNRYKDIIELEKAKITFYLNIRDDLNKLKEFHIDKQKISKEKEKLENFENQILEKSISEQNKTEASDFVLYEKNYLEALKQYSPQISSSTNQNLFEEITKDFQSKTVRNNE